MLNLQALLTHNAKVYIAARNEVKAKYAIAELKEQTGKKAIFLKLDLADLKSVKSAAEEFMRYAWSNIYYSASENIPARKRSSMSCSTMRP
jgi:NAD(P)-dependent dehydrogenase (short-subunit alcohol dehydrogenase family)